MGRRASKGSATASNPSANPVQQLNMLRDFCTGAGSWTEPELTDCLRQCGYNVERAAERLMTGQYKASSAAAAATAVANTASDQKSNAKSVFLSLVSSPSQPTDQESSTIVRRKNLTASLTKSAPLPQKRKSPPLQNAASKRSPVQDLTDDSERWLLCQRWLSDSVCTTKNGRVGYKEELQLTHSLTGHAVVRFRGTHVEGKLPENLARMLTPLLRMENDGAATSLIALHGQALMEENRMQIGSQVPIALTVSIIDPKRFFQVFDGASEANSNNNNMFFNKQRKSKKRRLPITEAAFDLLQWAEYGDVPEFQVPGDAADTNESAGNTEEDEEDEDAILNEDEFEEASVAESTAEAKEWDQQVNGANSWMMTLPEATDPKGFKDVSLRPYQRQALHWMMKREQQGESREELEKQLTLLSELATNQKPRASTSHNDNMPSGKEIVCDCGPVLVSQAARKRSKTVDGQVDPVNHALWQRRYLASEHLNESISFYVSELLGVATHRPPDPPKPCSGGILADSMGLGKTVMLLALILKTKEELPAPPPKEAVKPAATLVVAKLSLLPQWEDELKTKTDLSHLIYYGQQGSRFPTKEEMEGVDVVVTTYGTVQGDLNRKNPAILNSNWLRVILDEAHCIKNQKTLASKVCCILKAEHRWCVSGTIVNNSLDDVYGIMKFLAHEPWCLPPFWKAAITKPMTTAPDGDNKEKQEEGVKTALDRVRRLLAPLMIRRTKDSLSKDGKPILTLPPVETKIIKVDLSEGEREFYNAVLSRSLEVFEGFVESGTAAKSYLQIFTLLQRLRQICDHIALTVKSRLDSSDDWNASASQDVQATPAHVAATSPKTKTNSAGSDALGKQFLSGLLEKFCSKQSSPKKQKRKSEIDSPTKRPKDETYVSKMAHALTTCVKENSTHVNEECPICLEHPKVIDAVLTPCAHVFCRICLVDFLRNKASTTNENRRNHIGNALQCPDGECPCCNEKIDAKRIIILSKSGSDGSTVTSSFLTDTKPSARSATSSSSTAQLKREILDTQEGNPHAVARQILENAVKGEESSKMTAIMKELNSIWILDPGSKVLIFSQYLGFLDLMETQLRSNGIPFFRLDGSLTLKERMVVLDQFRSSRQSNLENTAAGNNKGTVLLMSMSAGGEGLNLVAASSVFIVDPWWTAAKEDQCIARLHRIGQTAAQVRVRKFVVNDSVEERILELQSRKKYIAEEIYNDAGRGEQMGSARLGLDEFKLIFQK